MNLYELKLFCKDLSFKIYSFFDVIFNLINSFPLRNSNNISGICSIEFTY